jgi:transposase
MARRKIAMIEVKEILYRWCQGMGKRTISRTLGIARNTIREILNQAFGLGLTKESAVSDISDIAIKLQEARSRKHENPNRIQSRLKLLHAQLEAWWNEAYMTVTQMVRLLAEQGETISETSLRTYVKLNLKKRPKTTVHLTTTPGQQGQVDFSYVGLMKDPVTDKLRKSYAFVMTLSHSRYRFVRFVFRQDVVTWIDCHIRAFQFFNGVPKTVLLDNLRSGVNKPDIYDPLINRTYAELERHYGFVVDPAKIRQPKHKGKVERSMTIIKQQLIAGRAYSSIDEANKAALRWCKEVIAHRVTRTTGETPWNLYIRDEKPALIPLPEAEFERPTWQSAWVHDDHHIVFAGSFYSLPERFVNQQVFVRATEKLVQIFLNEQLIKSHPKASKKGQWITDELDYSKKARIFLKQDATYCLSEAKKIGEAVYQFLIHTLTPPSLTRQRKAQAVLRLVEDYGPQRLEAACQRAILFDNFDFKSLKKILEENLEQLPLEDNSPVTSKFHGLFLRNPEEFLPMTEVLNELR